MKRKRVIVAATTAALGLAVAAPGVSAKDKDCDDFKSQRAAQKFFKKHNPKSDPHRLDADGDGKACEDYDY